MMHLRKKKTRNDGGTQIARGLRFGQVTPVSLAKSLLYGIITI